MLSPDKKTYIVWENRTLGYFLGDICYYKGGVQQGHLDGDQYVSDVVNCQAPPACKRGKVSGNKLIRDDGTEFLLIEEDDECGLSDIKVNPAHQ